VIIVHDYLTQCGGAERVVLAMHRAFPEAPIYTSLFQPVLTFPEFIRADVRAMGINMVGSLRRHHRLAMPLLAAAFSGLKLRADVILCSSSGWSHGIHAEGRKIVYCHTPARWLYQTNRYLEGRGRVIRGGFTLVRPALARWDRRTAQTADRYLTQSTIVQQRIRTAYGIEAEVVPAPYAVASGANPTPVRGIEPGYFLCVARLLPYKNVDAVLKAFAGLPSKKIVVVGQGPERRRLEAAAPANARFLGTVTDPELAWLYANSVGLVAASFEDYGLTPLEAAAFGRPSVVLRWGGFLDTVKENETGVFFDEPTPMAIRAAVVRVNGQFDPDRIRNHAAKFSEETFVERLRQIVAEEASLA